MPLLVCSLVYWCIGVFVLQFYGMDIRISHEPLFPHILLYI